MGEFSSEFRQRIVKEELERLRQEEYISDDIYSEVVDAQNQYYTSLAENKTLELSEQNKAKINIEAEPVKPVISNIKQEKAKKTLSPQEVRERNITWSLNLGVILLLIGGLVLATSTWDTLNNWMKTGLIGLVSVLFFGLAYFSGRILKIEKTAFAFHVLGSLFLPIVILSAAYFELFGSYFSFTGEGRYIYGAIGTLVILPVYLLLSVRLKARLFVWFSYVTISVLVSFLIAALYLPVDGFYLGIMAFNGCLIIVYNYFRKNKQYELFIKEFVAYIQANLVLSTFLMLVFYNHELVHSFTLILTAILYFSMIFVANQKEYHFVFSVMLIYGAYQLIEFSMLNEISGIAYALLGFIFLVLPIFIKDNASLQKAFRYTSAIVSACAFIYISLEGLLLRINEPSIVLLIAYVIISLNFTFLSNIVKQRLFYYLSPIFFVAALYQAVRISQGWFGFESLSLAMFLTGVLLYIGFGCYMKLSFFKNIKASSRDIAIIVMGICILVSFVLMDWWQLGTMLLLLSVIAIFMDKFDTRTFFTESMIATWIHPIMLGLAVTFYYGELLKYSYNSFYFGPLEAENLVLAGVIVLFISLLWRSLKHNAFYDHSFFVAHGFYALGIMNTFTLYFDDLLRALIVLGGIGMTYLLYRKTRWQVMPYIVSAMSLLFYHTVLHFIQMRFEIYSDLYNALQFVIGALLLLLVGFLFRKTDKKLMESFWWVGHLYLPIALCISYMFYEENAIWAFGVATIIYGISLQKTNIEWMTKALLYACCTSFWFVVSLAMILLELREYVHYSFLLTSAIIGAVWFISKGTWSRRIAYYAVPFSITGISMFTYVSPYDLSLLIVTLLYAIGVLFLLHKEKWDVLNIIPLILGYSALGMYGFELFPVTVFAIVLTAAGLLLYKYIYNKENNILSIDWYTIVGLFAVINLYNLTGEALWTKLLPGILICVNLFLQRRRIPNVPSKWMVFASCAFLLQPYYTVLSNIQIPQLFERELYVLPWIILVIFLKNLSGIAYKQITNYIQWAVLVIVSLLLIQDALASSTIYDALILGTLALISILAGMSYQIKSFFFVGAGVLLLNVFLQTRPYWGNMPWWAYLLIAGSILITVASYNEWHKQKSADGKETMISIFKEKVISKIKKWE